MCKCDNCANYEPVYTEEFYVPRFNEKPLSLMNNDQWEEMKRYYLGPSYKPAFDADEVRRLIKEIQSCAESAFSSEYRWGNLQKLISGELSSALLTALNLEGE